MAATMTRWGWLKLYWPEIATLVAVVLPLAALPVLGFLWLLEQGLALWWLGGLLALSALAAGLRLLPRRANAPPALPAAPESAAAAEKAARAALAEIAAGVSAEDVADAAAARLLLERAVRAVANAYHPDDPHAPLRVTLPELLLMTESFAGRIRRSLSAELPILAHLELTLIPQGLAMGRRGRTLWDAWRVLRFADPVSALLQEARAAIVNAAVTRLTAAGKAQAAAILVREAGEAAISLYAGDFARAADDLAPPAPVADRAPGPTTILVAGRRGAGKSALINALSGRLRAPEGLVAPVERFEAWPLAADGAETVLLEAPGVDGKPSRAWLDEAASADLVLWAVRAHDPARGPDRAALDALRERWAADPARRRPPVVVALTCADRLDPPAEWAPPYDPAGERPKEQAMRAAAAAAEAALGAAPAIPVSVSSPEAAWNLDALRAALAAAAPDAERRKLERALGPAGWAARARDAALSVPGLARQAARLARGVKLR
ncbi:MAG: hypothetical protein EA355_06000 [Rhodobacteraceae bacterium]|nr:MAG: hypothetical protein EA355_06000 [Paracoccaceae bacterium]